MKVRKTARGFKRIEFDDENGSHCSLQESSLAKPAAIRFGVDEIGPLMDSRHYGVQLRMHLSQAQVRKLLPALQYFAETGYLPDSFKQALHKLITPAGD